MNTFLRFATIIISCTFFISACGETAPTPDEVSEKHLEQELAAKVPYGLTKSDTPVLTTYEWETLFGGDSGKDLKYDQFGEIDELVFVAPAKTVLTLQRQIRRQTKTGDETLYYKVSTPLYEGTKPLWVDGRFLEVMDVKPTELTKKETVTQTLINLRTFEGLPFTWNGGSEKGIPELLLYYPPTEKLTPRTESDWILKGFSTLGLLFRASGGQSPLELNSIARFGSAVPLDLENVIVPEGKLKVDAQAEYMMSQLKPLDILQFGSPSSSRIMIVLDRNQVIEAKYGSKFAGKVVVSNLIDTVYGLLTKGTFVSDPLQDVPGNKFFVRRYIEPVIPQPGTTDPSSAADAPKIVIPERSMGDETP